MKAVLKDEKLNASLMESGYTVLPFLNEDEIKTLESLFLQHTNKSDIKPGLYSNLYFLDGEINWIVSLQMERVCSRAFTANFKNCELNGGVFIAKGPGKESDCNFHQDWCNTNEKAGATYSIWIPLVDIDERTGKFYVVPRTHLLKRQIRSLSAPSSVFGKSEIGDQHIVSLNLKAGEAVIFDHALFHGSGPNLTGDIRISAVVGILPDESPYLYYQQQAPGVHGVYNMDKEWFVRHFKENILPKKMPAEKYAGEIASNEKIQLEELLSFIS